MYPPTGNCHCTSLLPLDSAIPGCAAQRSPWGTTDTILVALNKSNHKDVQRPYKTLVLIMSGCVADQGMELHFRCISGPFVGPGAEAFQGTLQALGLPRHYGCLGAKAPEMDR